jgi:toxin ParE1/3/4
MATAYKTPTAKRDLADVWHFIAPDNLAAADRLIDSVQTALLLLANHPGMGRTRMELGPNVRSFPVGNYILYYRAVEGGIELLRVIHGARNVRDLSTN